MPRAPLARCLLAASLVLVAGGALAQPAPPAAPPGQPAKDVPMARLLTEGAQLRAVDAKDRLLLQFGRLVFLCRPEAGKPTVCDVVP